MKVSEEEGLVKIKEGLKLAFRFDLDKSIANHKAMIDSYENSKELGDWIWETKE